MKIDGNGNLTGKFKEIYLLDSHQSRLEFSPGKQTW
jgi:hypothetical protein